MCQLHRRRPSTLHQTQRCHRECQHVRFLIICLLVLIAAVGLAIGLMKDSGVVVIAVHDHVIRTSLAFFVLITLALVAVVTLTLRWLVRLWHAPRTIQAWSRHRREQKALHDLSSGFLALVQGDWRNAERAFSDGADVQ